MIIEKILNNNVVITSDERKKEIVVMGRGIAFKKKVGDTVNKEGIDKKFILSDENMSHKLQEIILDTPVEYMKLSDKIINEAKLILGKKLSDNIYVSLTDHIYTAIKRFKEGITLKNKLLWDIKRFYKDEFKIGIKALSLIEEKFDVTLPEDEAGFIALHIVNNEMDQDIRTTYEITKIMQEISNIVKYYFKIDFNEDSVYFYRFITHLRFFAERLIDGKTYEDSDNDDLLEVIKSKYKNPYNCVNNLCHFINEKYNYTLSNEEKLYLTIHIERVVSKTMTKIN